MILWFIHYWRGGDAGAISQGARIALAALLSFTFALCLGPVAIRWLKRRRVGERVDSASEKLNQLHAGKQNTPTMGGLFIVAAIIVATLICADLSSTLVRIGLFAAAAYTVIGASDDYVKLTSSRRGLSAKAKGLALLGMSLLVGLQLAVFQLVWKHLPEAGGDLQRLAVDWSIPTFTGLAATAAWSGFVLLATTNAVNLTDGLDGLAAGCVVCAGTAVTALAYLSGHRTLADHLAISHVIGAGELAVLGAATVGATLGFLWFNAAPAQVFMGDAGSLPLGSLLAYISLAIQQEWLFALIGGVFVVEALSVIAQVSSFKLTGRRILACSPLHHHFQFRGMPETRIVARFWIIAALLAIAGLACVLVRRGA